MKKFNWPLWAGFLLTFLAAFSYEFVFVEWPITRDVPWANFLMFAVAMVLLFMGVRRAFRPERRLISRITAPILATISILIIALFMFITLIQSRWLPASQAAPTVGQKAPEFTLTDTNGQPVALTDLLSKPLPRPGEVALAKSEKPRAVLLIFYRGYW